MKRLFLFLSVFVTLALLTACSLVKPIEFKGINSFQIEDKPITSGVAISTNVSLYNPNGFNFTINSADIDVIVEGVNMGKLQVPEKVTINAREEFPGDFRIEMSFAKVLMAGKGVLSKFKTGEFQLQLKGTIDADFLWMQKKFDVDYSENINLN